VRRVVIIILLVLGFSGKALADRQCLELYKQQIENFDSSESNWKKGQAGAMGIGLLGGPFGAVAVGLLGSVFGAESVDSKREKYKPETIVEILNFSIKTMWELFPDVNHFIRVGLPPYDPTALDPIESLPATRKILDDLYEEGFFCRTKQQGEYRPTKDSDLARYLSENRELSIEMPSYEEFLLEFSLRYAKDVYSLEISREELPRKKPYTCFDKQSDEIKNMLLNYKWEDEYSMDEKTFSQIHYYGQNIQGRSFSENDGRMKRRPDFLRAVIKDYYVYGEFCLYKGQPVKHRDYLKLSRDQRRRVKTLEWEDAFEMVAISYLRLTHGDPPEESELPDFDYSKGEFYTVEESEELNSIKDELAEFFSDFEAISNPFDRQMLMLDDHRAPRVLMLDRRKEELLLELERFPIDPFSNSCLNTVPTQQEDHSRGCSFHFELNKDGQTTYVSYLLDSNTYDISGERDNGIGVPILGWAFRSAKYEDHCEEKRKQVISKIPLCLDGPAMKTLPGSRD
tara:strand:+ start:82822 stop:84357 length:1536 start_codon:yes stop_codon:yes gene_type:complete